MNQNRKLRQLKNIGAKLTERLNEVGIHSENDLRAAGPVKAHQLIRSRYPTETLPLCYYLYSLDGALSDKHWNDIGEKRKLDLKQKVA